MAVEILSVAAAMALFTFRAFGEGGAAASPNEPSQARISGTVRELTLDECLSTAMEKSHRRPASRFAVAMAEAQHRQALSGYWPQIGLKGAYQRMDEAPNFLFPATTMQVPPQSMAIPAGSATVTIPAGMFGNPVSLQLPITYPDQTINVPAQQLPIAAQDIKLMDPNSFITSANALWLLYDGGLRQGYRQQAKGWLDVVKQEARRTDLRPRAEFGPDDHLGHHPRLARGGELQPQNLGEGQLDVVQELKLFHFRTLSWRR